MQVVPARLLLLRHKHDPQLYRDTPSLGHLRRCRPLPIGCYFGSGCSKQDTADAVTIRSLRVYAIHTRDRLEGNRIANYFSRSLFMP